MIKKLFGINIAVKDLEAATAKYQTLLGVEPQKAEEGDFAFPNIQGVGFVFNNMLISLLTSEDENNPVGHFLKKRGEGIILISVESDKIEEDMAQLQENGMQFLLPDPFAGPYGKVNFIPPKTMHGVQIEVIQPEGKFKGEGIS